MVVSIPALLDLVRLLRHLPRDHEDLVVRIDQRAGLVCPAIPFVEALAPAVGEALHESVIVKVVHVLQMDE